MEDTDVTAAPEPQLEVCVAISYTPYIQFASNL